MKESQPVAEGVYRLGSAWVGWYAIVDDAVTVVDCGFPGYHHQLPDALSNLGRSLDSVTAVVLTHYHPDHVGSAERIRAETGATVYVPAGDADGIRSGKVPLPSRMVPNMWRPRMARYMAHVARNGGTSVNPVAEFITYEDGDVLPGAGGLRAVHTPGHTAGHCSLVADRAGVLFAADALATFSFLGRETGPQLMAFNEDRGKARASLSRLENLVARTILVGHGDPFEGSPAEAVRSARATDA